MNFPVVFGNGCEGLVDYTWDPCDEQVRVEPSSGTVEAGQLEDAIVTITPAQVGPLHLQAACHVRQGRDVVLTVRGLVHCAAPPSGLSSSSPLHFLCKSIQLNVRQGVVKKERKEIRRKRKKGKERVGKGRKG